ncbi:hypothetical protein ACW0KB_17670 [Virgibacillus salarius]
MNLVKRACFIMAIGFGYLLSLLSLVITYLLSKGKSIKRKYIYFGIMVMTVLAPFLSFAIGLTYARIVENGWAALIIWYLFPLFFLLGLILLLVGTFKKRVE